MSYILDALKKAQAERQLGHAPTIHAPPPTYAPPAGRASRMPLLIGVGVGAAVAALGAMFLMRQPAPAPAVQVAAAPVAAPSAAARPAPDIAPAVQAPAAPPAAAPALPEPAPAATPPEPVKVKETAPPKPAPAAAVPNKAGPAAAAVPPVAAAPGHARPVAASVAPPAAPPVVSPAPAPAPVADDNVGPLAALPEAVQRDIPRVAFGGYIYSPNPAERLLLVDKMLRREGEEVAPGLVLERLLPKAAIMNYRGYRYRVAY